MVEATGGFSWHFYILFIGIRVSILTLLGLCRLGVDLGLLG
jgi:hypothetical protein